MVLQCGHGRSPQAISPYARALGCAKATFSHWKTGANGGLLEKPGNSGIFVTLDRAARIALFAQFLNRYHGLLQTTRVLGSDRGQRSQGELGNMEATHCKGLPSWMPLLPTASAPPAGAGSC